MKLDFTSDINKGYEAALSYPRMDRFIVSVHWWSFASILLLAFTNAFLKIAQFYPSPFAWRVITIPEAIGAILVALVAVLIPTLLIGKFKNHYYWRLITTTTLSFLAYVVVFLGGGSIEMHFMFFGLIALIAIYADWRLGWFMLVLVGLHHGILNYVAPTWVYFYGRNDFSVFAHAIPVIIAVIFTTVLCNIHRTTIQQIETLRGDLRAMNEDLKREKRG